MPDTAPLIDEPIPDSPFNAAVGLLSADPINELPAPVKTPPIDEPTLDTAPLIDDPMLDNAAPGLLNTPLKELPAPVKAESVSNDAVELNDALTLLIPFNAPVDKLLAIAPTPAKLVVTPLSAPVVEFVTEAITFCPPGKLPIPLAIDDGLIELAIPPTVLDTAPKLASAAV